MSEVNLRPHEYHVKHKSTGKTMVINKSRYNEAEYEILAKGGEGGGTPVAKQDAPSTPPSITKEGSDVEVTDGVSKVKGTAKNKAEAPVPSEASTPPGNKGSKSPTQAMKQ